MLRSRPTQMHQIFHQTSWNLHIWWNFLWIWDESKVLKRKEERNRVWRCLFSNKSFIKHFLLHQTRFACLTHLSQISSNILNFITVLSAKHKSWIVFRTLFNNQTGPAPEFKSGGGRFLYNGRWAVALDP